MWENRQQLLSQSLNYQMFLRDAKMGEVALSQQENFLSKVDTPVSAPRTGDMGGGGQMNRQPVCPSSSCCAPSLLPIRHSSVVDA